LHLAKKLALVTRVGGGNGLNLDSFPPAKEYTRHVGNAYVLASDNDIRTGTYLDLVTGRRVTKGYADLLVVDSLPEPSWDVSILKVEDDTEDIWLAASYMAMLLLDGKDVYLDLSRLRPEGSPVSGSGGTSSGPASFAVEIFDSFARWSRLGGASHAGPVATLRYLFAPTLRVIRQGGVRRGAGMATLSASHPDIEDFITSKALRRERLEGDISTFNISVLVDDVFMQRYQAGDFDTVATFHAIAEQAWATGEPGLLVVDTINKNNPLAERDGPIVATNPCG
jgi:ribonucleoside-diphosphate reductase alpha chain